MKEEIILSSFEKTLQLISNALDGKTTMEMSFVQISTGYNFLINDVSIVHIPFERLMFFFGELRNLLESSGLIAEGVEKK